MKSSFVFLSIALLLSSLSNASNFGSPSQPPVMSPTPEPSNYIDCSSVIYSMVDCLSFLTVGSTDPSPTKTCCVGINTVLKYNPKCFCSALESSREMGFELDDTKALAMPKICNVPIDPHCDESTTAAPTPSSPSVESPTTSPSSTKSPAITPSSPPVSHSSPPVSHASPPVSHASPPVSHASPPVSYASPPVSHASPPVRHASPPVSHSSPPVSHASPPVRHASPPVSHSSPPVSHKAPPVSHKAPEVAASSPVQTISSSTVTASPPPATSRPAPTPPKSSTGILSVSKLFLAVVMVSSFGFILA